MFLLVRIPKNVDSAFPDPRCKFPRVITHPSNWSLFLEIPYQKVIIVKFHSYASHIGHIFHSREPFETTTMMTVDSQLTLSFSKIVFYIVHTSSNNLVSKSIFSFWSPPAKIRNSTISSPYKIVLSGSSHLKHISIITSIASISSCSSLDILFQAGSPCQSDTS